MIRSSNDLSGDDGALAAELLAELRVLGTEMNRMEHAVAEALGVGTTDVHCLEILERVGPLPASRLAAEAGLSRGALTAAVDRLERGGYVCRRDDPSDGRRVLVAPGPAADRLVAAFQPLVEASLALHRGYRPDQLRLLVEFVRRTRGLLFAHAARLREQATRPRTRSGGR